jgi:hypothetical protein
LEIAVDQLTWKGGKALCQALHRITCKKCSAYILGDPENVAQAVIHEIFLLPSVEPFVEGKLQMKPLHIVISAGDTVKKRDPPEYGLITRPTDIPRFIASGPEVLLAEIFKPEKTILFGSTKHLGNRNPMT